MDTLMVYQAKLFSAGHPSHACVHVSQQADGDDSDEATYL